MIALAIEQEPQSGISKQRRALLATVAIARKSLAMQEDDYRALLLRIAGASSAKRCTDSQLREVIGEFSRMGFRPRTNAKPLAPNHRKTVWKAQAMWISLYQLGAIDDGSDAALEAFGRRQLRVDRLQWSNEREAYRLIEALKAMATRHGWDQRIAASVPTPDRIRLLKDRLVQAQLTKLVTAGITVPAPLSGDRSEWSIKRLESAAAKLARTILKLNETSKSPSN